MDTAPPLKSTACIAHRGYHARCVENTLEAFASAYGLGCDMVEFDVQLSADGVPVIFHDDDLSRLAGRPETVSALSAREISRVALKDRATWAVGRISTLAEFLGAFDARPFYLEIKVPKAKTLDTDYWQSLTEEVVGQVTALPAHPEAFVASFHPGVVGYALSALNFPRAACIHENMPRLRVAMSAPVSDPLSRRLFDSLPFSLYQEALYAGLPLRPERVMLWDVEGEAAFQAAHTAGVAGVVADDVPEMMRVFS